MSNRKCRCYAPARTAGKPGIGLQNTVPQRPRILSTPSTSVLILPPFTASKTCLPDHCKADFDTDVTPIAAINLIDYPHHLAPIPSELLPVFHTFRYPQERARFVAIDPVFEVFAPPKTPPQGQTIRELIAALPAARVLDLAPGEQP